MLEIFAIIKMENRKYHTVGMGSEIRKKNRRKRQNKIKKWRG
jgi:hypothetical protein